MMIKKIQQKIYDFSLLYGKKLGLDLPYFVKNGFWMTLRQIVILLSGMAVSIIFARIASKDIYGNYQLFISIFSIVSILSIPGLNNSIVNSVSRGNDGDYSVVVKKSFFWSLIGIPVLLILGAFYFHINKSLGISLMVSSIFFPFYYAPNTWNAFLQGKRKYSLISIYSSVQSVANALATILVILFYRNR